MNNFRNILIAAVIIWILCIIMYLDGQKLAPAAFYSPKILIFLAAVLALAMVIDAYRKEKSGFKDTSAIPEKLRACLFGLLIIVYVAVIEPVGYFIATPIYLIGSYLYLKAGKIRDFMLLSIGITVFIYVSFVWFLTVPVPMGPFM